MSPKTPILLEAIDVEKHYGKFAALGGVSLQVRANTVHSVIGPNGAGKTTLFHMLTGTKAVSGGRILFDGQDVTHEPDHRPAPPRHAAREGRSRHPRHSPGRP